MKQSSLFAEYLLTDKGWLSDQLIGIENGQINSLTSVKRADSGADFFAQYLIPGMSNMHSHGFQWCLSGLAEDHGGLKDSFWSWRQLMYKFLQIINPEDLHIIAQALYVDMLKAGYTAVGEFHYLHNDFSGAQYQQAELLSVMMIEAALNTGLSICHLPVLYQYAGFSRMVVEQHQRRFYSSDENYLDIVNNLRKQYTNNQQVNIGIAPHSLRAVDVTQLDKITTELALEQPVHIHISEQLMEVDSCLEHFNKRPIELLFEHIEVNHNWSLIHATHATSGELALIAKSQATVGLCISTEANLGDGFFNLKAYAKAGGVWGIGSDSHISIDPVEELRWLEYGQRLNSNQRASYASSKQPHTAQNLYLDAVKGGAKALAFNQRTISIGAKADFISLTPPSCYQYLTAPQLFSKWIFSNRQNWIDSVMVSGKWVVREKQHQLDDYLQVNLAKVLKKIIR